MAFYLPRQASEVRGEAAKMLTRTDPDISLVAAGASDPNTFPAHSATMLTAQIER